MVQKRHHEEDEPSEVSSKQLRPLEPSSHLVSALEFPYETAYQIPHAPDDGDKKSAKEKPECDQNLTDSYSGLQFFPNEDAIANSPSPLPFSSWPTSSISDEDIRLDEPYHYFLPPEQYNFEHLPSASVHPEEMYSFLLDYSPRKLVPVGPAFQADIPELECAANGNRKTLCCSGCAPQQNDVSDEEKYLAGSVVVAMPDLKALSDEEVIGVGRTGCLCDDAGSTECVELHIQEAREKLKRTIGTETFAKLGFCDMGEVVAEKWSEEEEHLFHEIVFSNPASLGKNFWDHLAVAFPSRTKKEIVSYYFNVFMLRRRAEQNRFDVMNIDSDNDEWVGPLDSVDNEVGVDEDEYDSVVESPIGPDESAPGYQCVVPHETRHPDIQDGSCTSDDADNALKVESPIGPDGSAPGYQCVVPHETRDPDVQDGSCTSDDADNALKVAVRSDNGNQLTEQFSGRE